MKKLKLILFLTLLFNSINITCFSQDTVHVINGIKVHFCLVPPKKLYAISNYIPIKNDSLKLVWLKKIEKYLQKYPISLSHSLKEIYYTENFHFANESLAGVAYHYEGWLVLSIINNRMQDEDYDFQMERTFHHEVSHILYQNFKSNFNQKKWVSFNDGKYLKWKQIKSGDVNHSLRIDTLFLKKGFSCPYGIVDIREDFAMFAEALLTPRSSYEAVIYLYPKAYEKHKMILEFYKSIDSNFYTDRFFENLKQSTFIQKNIK